MRGKDSSYNYLLQGNKKDMSYIIYASAWFYIGSVRYVCQVNIYF